MILVALGTVEASAAILAVGRRVAIGTTLEAGDHHLLVVMGGNAVGSGPDGLWLVTLLVSERRCMTRTAFNMAMGSVIETSVAKPNGGNAWGQ